MHRQVREREIEERGKRRKDTCRPSPLFFRTRSTPDGPGWWFFFIKKPPPPCRGVSASWCVAEWGSAPAPSHAHTHTTYRPKALRARPKEIRVAACFFSPHPSGRVRVFFCPLSQLPPFFHVHSQAWRATTAAGSLDVRLLCI